MKQHGRNSYYLDAKNFSVLVLKTANFDQNVMFLLKNIPDKTFVFQSRTLNVLLRLCSIVLCQKTGSYSNQGFSEVYFCPSSHNFAKIELKLLSFDM